MITNPRTPLPSPPHQSQYVPITVSLSLVEIKFEVEAAWAKGVEPLLEEERMASAKAVALLLLWVQWILSHVKPLPHFWNKQTGKHQSEFSQIKTTCKMLKNNAYSILIREHKLRTRILSWTPTRPF